MLLEEASPRGLSMRGLVLGTALGALYREARAARLEPVYTKMLLSRANTKINHALFERTMMPWRRIEDL